jgi:molybdopterin/thiamine biosynthesis adenylyltransferase/molybdopterin converting factor small subunit
MAKILIPTPLRQFADKKDSVQLAGATVGEVLKSLTSQYADLRRHLYNDEGKLRSFVNVYVNDEDIRYLNKEATPLNDGDTVSIVPSIAGGSAGVAAPPAPPPTLSKDEILRYSRHLIMPEVGMEGQLKLKAAKVALIGTGGLGAPLGMYLAAAGIGRIGLVDFDVVDFTNLQRQVIHGTKDVGKKKLDSAAETMLDINPYVQIDRHEVALTSENALDILKDYDIVVDGTDNFPTRYLVNDACVLLKKPNVYGSIFRFEGQATIFAYPGGPCYRCLYPEPPPPGLVPSCAEGGVLGILPGTVGLIQATETVKLILGIGEPLIGRLVLYDALGMRFRELKLRRNPECPVCGDHPTITKLIDYQEFCGVPNQPHQEATTQGSGRRDRTDRSEGENRSRRPFRFDRCARAARISDLQYPASQADPVRRSAQARE